jgi:hypothetical protein
MSVASFANAAVSSGLRARYSREMVQYDLLPHPDDDPAIAGYWHCLTDGDKVPMEVREAVGPAVRPWGRVRSCYMNGKIERFFRTFKLWARMAKFAFIKAAAVAPRTAYGTASRRSRHGLAGRMRSSRQSRS